MVVSTGSGVIKASKVPRVKIDGQSDGLIVVAPWVLAGPFDIVEVVKVSVEAKSWLLPLKIPAKFRIGGRVKSGPGEAMLTVGEGLSEFG